MAEVLSVHHSSARRVNLRFSISEITLASLNKNSHCTVAPFHPSWSCESYLYLYYAYINPFVCESHIFPYFPLFLLLKYHICIISPPFCWLKHNIFIYIYSSFPNFLLAKTWGSNHAGSEPPSPQTFGPYQVSREDGMMALCWRGWRCAIQTSLWLEVHSPRNLMGSFDGIIWLWWWWWWWWWTMAI